MFNVYFIRCLLGPTVELSRMFSKLPKKLPQKTNRVSLYLVPTVAQIRYFTKILAGGRCPPDPPIFGWGGKAPPDPSLKRSFVTFDRGGQTGPPRSNDFFSAPLTTRAPPTTAPTTVRRYLEFLRGLCPEKNEKSVLRKVGSCGR